VFEKMGRMERQAQPSRILPQQIQRFQEKTKSWSLNIGCFYLDFKRDYWRDMEAGGGKQFSRSDIFLDIGSIHKKKTTLAQLCWEGKGGCQELYRQRRGKGLGRFAEAGKCRGTVCFSLKQRGKADG